ncbi:MATH domain and coiled-coil domain-containing protein At3g58410-like isoform X1 [Tripterygium wilfordii]|uniref:MATH domain and coiled-coil domain-containing protein At3g58410-like isoform X1 n=1 Tax=Tripterygium wilfordii TaxID=458696 RepID=UPI0018F7FB5A|nr:MATH domain and coiled-coil domain-containing protein At3g58410-like isoform X1 [Tripterygium wilfordii]
MTSVEIDHGPGIRSYKRGSHPAHYMFKIKSLSTTEVEKYESGVFEVGGHKWSLAFYPTGNENMNGNDYISLYLVIENTEKLPAYWEVNVSFRLFLFDQIQDKYLTVEAADGEISRFHATKTEWGFAQFLSIKSFHDASNGYLVGDTCIIGAEVLVVGSNRKQDALLMIKSPPNNIMTWTLTKFSTLHDDNYLSEVFTIEESKWKLSVYPNGHGLGKGKYLSIFLDCVETVGQYQNMKVYVEFKLRIKKLARSSSPLEFNAKHWFSSNKDWGFTRFASLVDLRDPNKGLMENDCLTIEAEIMVISKGNSIT